MRSTRVVFARKIFSALCALALVLTGTSAQTPASAHSRLAKDSRVVVVVEPAVLSIPPHGPATLYRDERNAVTITADRAGGATAVSIAVKHSGPQQLLPHPAAAPVTLAKQDIVPHKQDVDQVNGGASGPVAASSGPAAAASSSEQTRNIPTVMVHGTWQNKDSAFPDLTAALNDAGFQTYSLTYGVDKLTVPGVAGAILGIAKPVLDQLGPLNPVNLLSGIPKFGSMLKDAYDGTSNVGAVGPIGQSTQELSRFIDQVQKQTGASKINLVGDSQGGLVIKNYLSQDTKDNVANVVDINATNHGTTLNGPAKLLDIGIVDDLAEPVHTAIANLGNSFNGTLLQGPAQIAAGAAQIGVQIAQSIVKIPVAVVQGIARVVVGAAIGPAAAEQAVGSDFINKLNATPDTKPGVSYLVLASTDDKTSTPYKATYLQAGTGSSVINVEEHTLPGAKDLDIEHVAQPSPVVKAIVDYLSGAAKNPDLAKQIATTPGVTVTVDNGVTTVQSGTKVLYQGPSSNTDQVKQSAQQAISATSPSSTTPNTLAPSALASSANSTAAKAVNATNPTPSATNPAATASTAKVPSATSPSASANAAPGTANTAAGSSAASASTTSTGSGIGGLNGGLGLSGETTTGATKASTSTSATSATSGTNAAPNATSPATGASAANTVSGSTTGSSNGAGGLNGSLGLSGETTGNTKASTPNATSTTTGSSTSSAAGSGSTSAGVASGSASGTSSTGSGSTSAGSANSSPSSASSGSTNAGSTSSGASGGAGSAKSSSTSGTSSGSTSSGSGSTSAGAGSTSGSGSSGSTGSTSSTSGGAGSTSAGAASGSTSSASSGSASAGSTTGSGSSTSSTSSGSTSAGSGSTSAGSGSTSAGAGSTSGSGSSRGAGSTSAGAASGGGSSAGGGSSGSHHAE